jgi:hypothetical protein
MLSERELEQTAVQLVDFRTASEQQQKTLTEVLEKHTVLMDEYKRLKSDYEEERDSRERYKQMARGQERNPFVLVLIDGDGYVFDDDLVSGGAEGGQKAATLLNEALKASLRSRGLEHCRIMVRVYANVAGLSKVLSKAKLSGPEKRSLAPFVASFNRSNDLFDFVDAGELKENADFKIRAMFRQFVDNAQCRHIYFGGCHDVGYISELTPYSGNRDRITLMRTPAFHHEFLKLGLRAEDFPNIFRGTQLEGQLVVSSIKTTPAQAIAQSSAPANDSTQSICSFYQKGLCKYGNGCRFLHVKKGANGTLANGSSSTDWRTPRQNSTGDQSTFQANNLSKSDNDFMRHSISTSPVPLPADLESKLPEEGAIPPGNVPVNKDHQRLDAYLPPTSTQERSVFNTRVHIQKLCNNYHLKGSCPIGEDCPYDHARASPAELKCLRQVIRNNPCPRKGGCRVLDCLNGHICQKPDCRYRGGSNFCKIPAFMHHIDLKLAGYEPANMPARGDSVDTIDENETVDGESLKGTTPPPRKTKSGEFGTENEDHNGNEHESDMEADGEGALLDLDDRPQD